MTDSLVQLIVTAPIGGAVLYAVKMMLSHMRGEQDAARDERKADATTRVNQAERFERALNAVIAGNRDSMRELIESNRTSMKELTEEVRNSNQMAGALRQEVHELAESIRASMRGRQ